MKEFYNLKDILFQKTKTFKLFSIRGSYYVITA